MNELHLRHLASPEWRHHVETELLPWALQQVDLGEHVVEIGPGPGLTTDLLRLRSDRVTAVELDGELAAALSERMAGTNVEVRHTDATDMGLEPASCSSVACFTMLHHVPTDVEQDRLFAEANRVLRSGGVFVGVDSLDSERIRAGHVDDFFNPVDPRTLGRRLEAAGFGDVTVEEGDGKLRFSAIKA